MNLHSKTVIFVLSFLFPRFWFQMRHKAEIWQFWNASSFFTFVVFCHCPENLFNVYYTWHSCSWFHNWLCWQRLALRGLIQIMLSIFLDFTSLSFQVCEDLLYYRMSQKNQWYFFWPFFWLFLTFWWSYHTKNTRLNIILCSNHHFKSIRIDLKGFEKLAIWPKTPDLGGYDPSPNDSLFWNYKNPFDQFEMITLSIILIAKAGGTQLFEGADLIGGNTRNLA